MIYCIQMLKLPCVAFGVRTWDTPSPPWKNANPQVDLSLATVKKDNVLPAEARARALEHIATYDGFIRVFTDGSKTSEGVGCSFIAGCETRSFSAIIFLGVVVRVSRHRKGSVFYRGF